jgi:hypothetical protein
MALAAFVVLAATAVQAGQVIDMRACPLDRTTFIDPVAGGKFTVGRVGADYRFQCADGMTRWPRAGEDCRGPFGDLVLAGVVREPDDPGPRNVFAVWTVKRTAPCCGWSVLDEAAGQAVIGRPGFRWLAPDAVPTLGAVSFADIRFDTLHQDGIEIFSPKTAMRCELAE